MNIREAAVYLHNHFGTVRPNGEYYGIRRSLWRPEKYIMVEKMGEPDGIYDSQLIMMDAAMDSGCNYDHFEITDLIADDWEVYEG